MNKLKKNLVTALRAHLGGGRARPPEAGILLWNIFDRLNRARSWHAHGPNPISYSEIEAYCRLGRQPLEPRHVDIIVAMDAAWIDHIHAHVAKAAPTVDLAPTPLTVEAFDAMFS